VAGGCVKTPGVRRTALWH